MSWLAHALLLQFDGVMSDLVQLAQGLLDIAAEASQPPEPPARSSLQPEAEEASLTIRRKKRKE